MAEPKSQRRWIPIRWGCAGVVCYRWFPSVTGNRARLDGTGGNSNIEFSVLVPKRYFISGSSVFHFPEERNSAVASTPKSSAINSMSCGLNGRCRVRFRMTERRNQEISCWIIEARVSKFIR